MFMAVEDDPGIDENPEPNHTLSLISFCGLVIGILVAADLRFYYALEANDFLWYDSTKYIEVAHHPFFSLGLWAGARPPLVPLMWKLTGTPTGFTALQSVIVVAGWSFLAWTVWVWLGRSIRGVVGAYVVLAFSLTPFVLQWDASVLTESISLAAVAVMLGAAIWLIRRFTWPRAAILLGAGLVFELARDEGIEVVAVIGALIAVIGAICALRHNLHQALRCAVLAAVVLATTGVVALAAQSAHRNVINVEDSLYVRIFPYPHMVAAFEADGMPQGRQIDAVARVLRAEEPSSVAYASPPPSRTTALVVGPVLTERHWAPLRNWIEAHGEATYLRYLLTHPGYVLTAPFHRPSLAFNSPPSLSYYQIGGHTSVPGTTVFFPRRIFVLAMLLVAAVLLYFRRLWRRLDIVLLVAAIPLGVFAMAVGWFGDGQEIARHMIEGNVMVRLAVLLLLIWGVLAPSPLPATPVAAPPAPAPQESMV